MRVDLSRFRIKAARKVSFIGFLVSAAAAICTVTASAGSGESLPQPISSATTVLKALFSVLGTQAYVVNDDLIKLDGPMPASFARVPGSSCKFIEVREGFTGQIDFSRLSGEYETSVDCLGGSCGIKLTLFGKGPAVCWTNRPADPTSAASENFSTGQCFSRITFGRMDGQVVRTVLRAVTFILSNSCPPVKLDPY